MLEGSALQGRGVRPKLARAAWGPVPAQLHSRPGDRPGRSGAAGAQDYAVQVSGLPDVHHVVVEHRHQPDA